MTVLQNKIAERAKRLLCFIDPFASLRVRTCLLPCYLKYYTRINLQSQGFISRFLTGMIITVRDRKHLISPLYYEFKEVPDP